MGKGWRAATRSEYRKVEELTLAGFFVITLLASTISGVEVSSLRRAPLRRPLAGSAKIVKRTKVRRRDDVGAGGKREMRFNLTGRVLILAKASQALFYESRESSGDAGSLSFVRVSEYLRGIYDFAVRYFHASCDFRAPLESYARRGRDGDKAGPGTEFTRDSGIENRADISHGYKG
ncbi:hypothetical protein ALC62_14637 [Cyphomyrmex costatus]|uniref:Uncharacterized protein n=1 Tax=Cyphomyrmex costatus TaxID=456900 RepID=A0A195C1D7_9HYME|nr:hypothetical protein ALC62_14637 [Cyphomyrmex costatus]